MVAFFWVGIFSVLTWKIIPKEREFVFSFGSVFGKSSGFSLCEGELADY